MRVLFASSTDAVTEAVFDTIGNSKNGCTELLSCAVEETPDRVAQARPDAVLMEVGNGRPEVAWEAIREVQETRAVRVLAVGPSTDAQLILRALKEGAYKYICVERVEEDLLVALRCVRQEPPLMMRRGRVIAVVGASGGCGASTIAVNIAAAYSRRQQRCMLVDLNLQGGDLAVYLRVQPTHSIADFCQHVDRMDAKLFESCLASQEPGLALLAPPLRYQEIGKVTARGVRKAITMARAQFPYVVVDVDRSYRPEHAQALYQSDVVVLVVRLDLPSLRQAGRMLAYFDDIGIGRERTRLVVNRMVAKSPLRERDVEAALKTQVALTIPEGAKDLGRALQRGVPLVIDYPRSRVAQRLTDLAVSLNGKMG